MKAYCLGFAFDASKSNVVLLKKENPAWQKGMYNGVGGHIEAYEDGITAMHRESIEEIGLDFDWKMFCVLYYPQALLTIYRTFSDRIYSVNSQTDVGEFVSVHSVYALHALPVVPNLKYLIPLALSSDIGITQITANGIM